MTWNIEFLEEAKKDLKKLNHFVQLQVVKGIEKVRKNPLPTDKGGYGKPLGNKNGINLTNLVTCSRHLNLTDFEVGASCSIALQGKAKTGYPRVSRGSFFIRLRIFSVLLCTFFIYSFSFFQNIDRRIHIPVHPVSTFA